MPGRVDDLRPVGEEHLRGDHADGRIALGGGDEVFEPCRFGPCVVVEHDQVVGLRGADALVAAGRKAEIGVVGDDARIDVEGAAQLGCRLDRTIVRPVVDEDDFKIRAGLHRQRGVERGQMPQTVVVDDDNANDVHGAQFYTMCRRLQVVVDVDDEPSQAEEDRMPRASAAVKACRRLCTPNF